MTDLGALIDALSELTLAQLDAAKKLDGATLTELNARRADLNFELQLALQAEISPEQRPALAAKARFLAGLERRLHAVANTVVEALDAAIPRRAPPTYGRTGRVDRR